LRESANLAVSRKKETAIEDCRRTRGGDEMFEKMEKHARLHRMVMKGGQGTESWEKSPE